MEDNTEEKNKRQIEPTASATLDDGSIVETVFRPEDRRTLLAIYNAGRWTLQDHVDVGSSSRLLKKSRTFADET